MKQVLFVRTFLLILSIFVIIFFSNVIDFLNLSGRKNIALAGNNLITLSATNISSDSITLEWVDNLIGETGFKIEKKFGDCLDNNPFGEIKVLEANTKSFVDNNISSGSVYCYRVRAYLGSLNSNYSNEIFVSTSNFTSTSNFPYRNNILSFSATPSIINLREGAKISWSADGSVHCMASDGWRGEKPISASQIVYPKKTSSYTLSCIWPDKTVISKSIIVEVKGSENEIIGKNYCYRNNFSIPLYQSSCLITPENHSSCRLTSSDKFSLNVIIPNQAVSKKANLQILIHNFENFKNLPNNIGNLKIVGDKIFQIVVKDDNCKEVDLLKEISISFSYPQSYENNFDENSFVVKKMSDKDNSWIDVLSKKDISSNIVVITDKKLGYFSLFGSKKYFFNQTSSTKKISSSPLVVDYNPAENKIILNSEESNPENFGLKREGEESFFKYLLASLANQTKNIGWKLAISVSVIFSLILISWFLYKRSLFKKMYSDKNFNTPILRSNKISNIKERIKKKREDSLSVSSISNNKIIEKNGDILIVREV